MKTKPIEHSLLPWTRRGAVITKGDGCKIRMERPKGAAPEAWGEIETRLAKDAEFIVRSANAHYALLEACNQAMDVITREYDGESQPPILSQLRLAIQRAGENV